MRAAGCVQMSKASKSLSLVVLGLPAARSQGWIRKEEEDAPSSAALGSQQHQPHSTQQCNPKPQTSTKPRSFAPRTPPGALLPEVFPHLHFSHPRALFEKQKPSANERCLQAHGLLSALSPFQRPFPAVENLSPPPSPYQGSE